MPKKPLSKGAKIGIGCGGAGCLTIIAIIIAAIIAVFVGGADTETAKSTSPSTSAEAAPTEVAPSTAAPTPSETAKAGTALAMLADLDVKGRAPKTGYNSDLFKWRSDTDHNGCDTRNDILRRDLNNITLKRGTDGCNVIAGSIDDHYLGESYTFDRDPNNIDIDHIVSRSNAWQTGAQNLDPDELAEFGNDPLNLIAVKSSLNRQKGDGDAATWLPPDKSYRCEYVARQVAVKHEYELWVVKAERDSMTKILDGCKDEPAFAKDVDWPATGDGDNAKVEKAPKKPKPAPEPEPTQEPEPAQEPEPDERSDYYDNCDAARAAGAAPVHRGDPGYGSHLDRDGDGVGCE